MKNLFKVLGIIALVAVIGFSFAACGNGGGNGGGGNGGNGNGGNGGGKLTVNNLPSGGTYTLIVFNSGTDISTLEKAATAVNNGLTSGNYQARSIAQPSGGVFSLTKPGASIDAWTGTGTFPVYLTIDISSRSWASVNFTNGIATVPFSNFTAVTQ